MLLLQGSGPVSFPDVQNGDDEGGVPSGVPGTHVGETDGGGLVAVPEPSSSNTPLSCGQEAGRVQQVSKEFWVTHPPKTVNVTT